MSNCDISQTLPPWLNNRAAGVLLHPSSLPGNQGIGSLGREARRFIDFLESAGFRYWQTCPVGPTGFGDSPYQVFCSNAGNPYFIDWTPLLEIGLLETSDLASLHNLSNEFVEYGYLYNEFYPVARTAYCNFKQNKSILESKYGIFEEFKSKFSWLKTYACFQALKLTNGNKPWWSWDSKHKISLSFDNIVAEHDDETSFHIFLQYLFFGQWIELKDYANQRGVSLLGDLPIYAAPDSSEVWANQNLFQICRQNSTFDNVAGVPPDYFNMEGQCWGNPLYDWDEHEKEGYSWWIDRLKSQTEIFDIVRIDHFRAFNDYWSIPSSGNAKLGNWELGPGMKFWDKINKVFPDRPFLAEDLGLITDEVRLLRKKAGLPGMAVLQFAFDGDSKNLYLPHNLDKNLVLYLGTHDNDTTCGWYNLADEEIRSNFRSYLNVSGEFPSWDLLRFAYRTISPLVIVSVQDLLSLGSEARFNCPGEAIGNWQWRLNHFQLDSLFESSKYLREQAKITGRSIENEKGK
tara:strand:- start:1082 stop:2632 length:1551 start_codon:yes stop_codon:yes gene_type:complete